MEPRFGRLYANAVLRPLAEQVLDALDVPASATVCDLMCDGGTMGVALGRAVGSQGRVVLVDIDAALLMSAAREVSATGCAVATQVAAATTPSLRGETFDRVASLCEFGFWDGGSLLDAAERATRPSGTAAVLTWDVAHPPAHEAALADALRDVAGVRSEFLAHCLATPEPDSSPRWRAVTLSDVVRFDGIAAYWAAMVAERPVASELENVSGTTLSAVRAACERALGRFVAADGTMLIPVRAALWCCRPGGRA